MRSAASPRAGKVASQGGADFAGGGEVALVCIAVPPPARPQRMQGLAHFAAPFPALRAAFMSLARSSALIVSRSTTARIAA